jgi:hypothetical protein
MTPTPVSQGPMEKIELIQRSLRCFTMGVIGVLPVVGIPFAVLALAHYFRVKRESGAQWNPAQQYLTWGLATALSGLFLTFVLTLVAASILVLNLA